ncbi:MAG TPA: ThuA domain-containing protein, partial [Chthoniobacteraceae bacterium]
MLLIRTFLLQITGPFRQSLSRFSCVSCVSWTQKLLSLFCVFGVFALTSTEAAPKKIVIIAGKKSHGPEGNHIHDYPWSARLIKAMLDNSNVHDEVRVEFHQGGWPKDPVTLEDADAIMIISDGRDGDKFEEAPQFASAEHAAIIQRQVDRGCGFLTFHFSTFAPNVYAKQILDWSGGYFQWETDGKKQWYSNLKIADADVRLPSPDHQIMHGVKPFHLHEEFYFDLRFDPTDKAFVPLLEVPALGGREPDGNIVAWARERANGGRGFGTSCGHFYDNWENPDFRKFILNAIVWSARAEVPREGIEAKFYDHDQIMAALDRSMGREALPETYEEPAAPVTELTPANGFPKMEDYRKWNRSHGTADSSRFSALEQITPANVSKLDVAWTYHTNDSLGNIQCNPIVVDGVMYAPTPGGFIAAVNAETGSELWRFQPDGPASGPRAQSDPPARRGLLYWPGNGTVGPRIFFTGGRWVYSVDAKTGQPDSGFGDGGHAPLEMGGTVAGAIYKNVLVIPGFLQDVF